MGSFHVEQLNIEHGPLRRNQNKEEKFCFDA